MSLSTNQTRLLYFSLAAITVGAVAYTVWGTNVSSSISTSTSSRSNKTLKPKSAAYTPSGDVQTWSEDDLKKFLTSRNMGVGHNPSHEELLAMAVAKLNEPTSTGFDDPTEWSVEDMRQYLEDNKLDAGHSASRMELLAMVESKMHEPK